MKMPRCERVAIRYSDQHASNTSSHLPCSCAPDPGSASATRETQRLMQLRISRPTVAARRISWRCDALSGADSLSGGSRAIDASPHYSVKSTTVAPGVFFCTEVMPFGTLDFDS